MFTEALNGVMLVGAHHERGKAMPTSWPLGMQKDAARHARSRISFFQYLAMQFWLVPLLMWKLLMGNHC